MKTLIGILVFLFIAGSLGYAQFPRDQKISAAEYFTNTDPGEGNGTPIPLTDTLWETSISYSLPDPPEGSRLYLRVKSTNGSWSGPRCVIRRDYFPNSGAGLSSAQYCIIHRSGGETCASVAIESDGTINLSNLPLARGDRVYFRLIDDFNRSGRSRATAFQFKDMYRAEYYIKQHTGGQTQPDTMTLLAPPNDSSSIFIATKNNVAATNGDTVYARFWTLDRFYPPWLDIIVGVREDRGNEIPTEYALFNNYPNPFNPETRIQYSLPKTSFTTLKIYDILGREVNILVNETQSPGYKSVMFDAAALSSGVYFYRLQAGSFNEVKKMLLAK